MRASIAIFAVLSAAAPAAAAAAQDVPPARASLTLAEALRLALEHSERVRIAEEEVRAADIRHTEAWTEMGPTAAITATGILQQEAVPGAMFTREGALILGSGMVNQPLFRMSFFDARTAGELGIQSREAALARTKEVLARDVVLAFIGVLRARSQTDLSRAAVERAKAQVQSASSRVKAGGALRTAELLASIELQRANLQLNSAERDARTAELAFFTLVGEAPPKELAVPPTPEVPAAVEALKKVEERSDVRALRLLAMQSRAQADAARGRRLWPRLDAQLFAQVEHPARGARTDWYARGVLTFPLFETGREHIQIDLQENATRVLEHQAQQLVEASVEELRRATVRVEAADRAAALADQQAKDALEHYQLVATQFRLGAITFLDVSNAQALLTEAESLKVVAIYDRELARYELLHTMGVLTVE